MGRVKKQQNEKITTAAEHVPTFPYEVRLPPTLPFSSPSQFSPLPGPGQAPLADHNLHTGERGCAMTMAKTGNALCPTSSPFCSQKPEAPEQGPVLVTRKSASADQNLPLHPRSSHQYLLVSHVHLGLDSSSLLCIIGPPPHPLGAQPHHSPQRLRSLIPSSPSPSMGDKAQVHWISSIALLP